MDIVLDLSPDNPSNCSADPGSYHILSVSYTPGFFLSTLSMKLQVLHTQAVQNTEFCNKNI